MSVNQARRSGATGRAVSIRRSWGLRNPSRSICSAARSHVEGLTVSSAPIYHNLSCRRGYVKALQSAFRFSCPFNRGPRAPFQVFAPSNSPNMIARSRTILRILLAFNAREGAAEPRLVVRVAKIENDAVAGRPNRQNAARRLRRRPARHRKRTRSARSARAGNLQQAAGADAVDALFVFLHLLEGRPERVAKLSWLMPSALRRKRTLAPTWQSIGCGGFVTVWP